MKLEINGPYLTVAGIAVKGPFDWDMELVDFSINHQKKIYNMTTKLHGICIHTLFELLSALKFNERASS